MSKKGDDLLRVEAELRDSRRSAARKGRVLGLPLLLIGAALAYMVEQGMEMRATYSGELLFISAWAMTAGLLMVVFGVGGASRVRDVPAPLWGVLAVLSGLIAVGLIGPLGNALAAMAGFEGL